MLLTGLMITAIACLSVFLTASAAEDNATVQGSAGWKIMVLLYEWNVPQCLRWVRTHSERHRSGGRFHQSGKRVWLALWHGKSYTWLYLPIHGIWLWRVNPQKGLWGQYRGASVRRRQQGKKLICEGFARTFKVLCNRLNVPAVLVFGMTPSGSHAWNYVQMEDNERYGMDVTWDNDDPAPYDYFLMGKNTVPQNDSETFINTHQPKGEFYSSSEGGIHWGYPVLADY